jgi:alkanesulfonate monooxygenase
LLARPIVFVFDNYFGVCRMGKQIRLNAFAMNTVGHQSSGLWRHPRDRSSSYNTIGYWTNLAKTLERGKFDSLFLADVLGVYDVYGGDVSEALRTASQIPNNDPALIVPVMAAVTAHLGFGLTSTLSYEPPFTFARRMSTLDHLTNGRIGWNIVTGYLNSAAKGAGLEQQPAHDTRYEIAAEYMDVVYKLWEASWEDGAALRDAGRGLFSDPARVHKVHHHGKYYQLDAVHLCEPSPQRTPVLYQAGASSKGRAFAAEHAECVFVAGPSKQVVAPAVADIRARAKAAGRAPGAPLIFTLMTVITGRDDAEAEAKFAEYKRYISHAGALTLMSGWTGIDFSTYQLSDKLHQIRNDAIHSAVDAFTVSDPGKVWTIQEIAEFAGIGGTGPVIVGGPRHVADELQGWIEDTGIDGFNLAYVVAPETFEDFVTHVVPELQRRGVYQTDYAPGTLREKLFGAGPLLDATHPGGRLHFGQQEVAA